METGKDSKGANKVIKLNKGQQIDRTFDNRVYAEEYQRSLYNRAQNSATYYLLVTIVPEYIKRSRTNVYHVVCENTKAAK